MKRSITRWTTAVATAALLAVPAAGAAQTGTTPQQPTTSQAPSQEAETPQDHLRKAKAALDGIEPTAVTGRAKTQVAELKRHLNALERAAGSNANASATATAQRNPRSTDARGNTNWGTEVAAIDKILTNLLGSDATSGATGTAGTTGTTGTAATAVSLDQSTRTALADVRRHVTNFAAAMSGTPAPTTAADPAASAATTGSTATTGTASTTGSPATLASGTTATDPQAQTGATQPDVQEARRHLTDARDTLSQLTQLPAAAQLSGEARTQVSQLIANFNELITTQTDWRASFAKVEANLDSLLGPDDPTMTGSTTGTTTSTATGTAGAVGTSGTAGAAANLDPAIRAKLVELRVKLKEFERAAGGGTPAAADPAAAASSATSGSMTAQTSQTPQTGATSAERMGHNEALRHIQAIEAILNANAPAASGTTGTTNPPAATGTPATTGTAGASLTLTGTQLDQLRTHLTELKKLVGEAQKK